MGNVRPPERNRLLRARNAVAVVFAVNGLAIATWFSRIPHVRDLLDLSPGEVGRVLLAMAAGSVVALPTAGLVMTRIGAARTILGGSMISGCGLIVAGIGADALLQAALVAAGLVALGYGSGSGDVAMNVEGASVERLLRRTIMPRFHAAWSLGSVLGAGLGTAAAAWDVSVAIHLGIVGVLVLTVPALASRRFLPVLPVATAPTDGVMPGPATPVWAAWRERRTLLIGVLVLCFALIEGTASDWLALGLVDGYGVGNAVGTAGLAVFVTCMTIGRTLGTRVVDAYGRRPVLQAAGVLTIVGVVLVVFGQALPVAALGVVCWGLGASLGFPLGMSAASDDPNHAPARVSVVASIGYTGFLSGPPLLGWLGDHGGILQALMVVVAAAIVGAVVSPAAGGRLGRRGVPRSVA